MADFTNITNVSQSTASDLMNAVTAIDTSSSIKLAALQKEYDVVTTMYKNAYQSYITSLSSTVSTTNATTTNATTTTATTTPSTYLFNKMKYNGPNGSKDIQSSTVTSAPMCQTLCANNPQCSGATYDASASGVNCWVRGGDGNIDTGDEDQNAIISSREFPIIILQMLNDKLTALNQKISAEINNTYSKDANYKDNKSMRENRATLTQNVSETNEINEKIANITNTVEQQFVNSKQYVTQKYSIFTLYFVVLFVIIALYVANLTFSIITLILLILIITVNTNIFSGIILFLFILFYFYFTSGSGSGSAPAQ